MWLSRTFCTLLTLLVVAGCAPRTGNEIYIDMSDEVVSRYPASLAHGIEVSVRQLEDARGSDVIGVVDGRVLRPASSVPLVVQSALERRLQSAGVRLRLFNSPSLGGSIKEWQVRITPAFPSSRADAVASIKLDAFDANGTLLYSGEYSGTASVTHPILTDARIEEALSHAMGYALDEALNDQVLIARLNQARSPQS